MAERANYTRQGGDQFIRYSIVSTGLGGLEQAEAARNFVTTAIALVIAGVIALGIAASQARTSSFAGIVVVCVYLAGAFFWGRSRRSEFKSKVSDVFGRRGEASLILDPSYMTCEYTSGRAIAGSEKAARSDIRRTRLINTMDKLDTQSRDSANLAAASAVGGVRGGAMGIGHAQAQAKTNKARQVCFSVVVDHGNSSLTVADGLDELTSRNLYDDLSRDLAAAMSVLASQPASRTG